MATGTPQDQLWKKFDFGLECPVCLTCPDKCYYAREYISKGGYKASEANNLISNFKIDSRFRDTNRWPHKRGAAAQFARDLTRLLPNGIAIAIIPTSKATDDPEYDPRFDIMLEILTGVRNDLVVCAPIVRDHSVEAAHKADHRPSSDDIEESLRYFGFDGEVPSRLVLIDDVITAGKQFMAYRSILLQHHRDLDIYGAFWAKTIWPAGDAGVTFVDPSTPTGIR